MRRPAWLVSAVLLAAIMGAPAAWAELPFPSAFRTVELPSPAAAAAVRDCNEDGHPDLLALGYLGDLHYFPGSPGGQFLTALPDAYRVDLGRIGNTNLVGLAAGDFDHDGHVDAFVSNLYTTAIVYGDGRGGFSPALHFDMGYTFGVTAVADLNGDGLSDLIALTESPVGVGVRLARGRGLFGGLARYATPRRGRALALGDFDGDGATDFVVGTGTSDTLTVLWNDGAGGFHRQVSAPLGLGGQVSDLTPGDVNGDGRLDLVIVHFYQTPTGAYPDIWIRLGDGQGGFSGGGLVLQGYGTPALVDLTDDGRLDLALLEESLTVRAGRGDGTFDAPRAWPVGGRGRFELRDLDGDGQIEIIAPSDVGVSIASLAPAGPPPPLPYERSTGRPSATRLVDLDGDGRLDRIGYIGHYTIDDSPLDRTTLATALGRGDGGFEASSELELGESFPGPYEVGEWTGDDHLDVLGVKSNRETLRLYAGTGDGHFALSGDVALPSDFRFRSFLPGDFDGDGRSDLLVMSYGPDPPQLLVARPSGGFRAALPLPELAQVGTYLVGDFTGDGRADVVADANASPTLSLWPGEGDGTLGALRPLSISTDGRITAQTADFDGDGGADLLITTEETIALYRNLGDAAFMPIGSFTAGGGKHLSGAVDFDGDGRPDLLIARGGHAPLLLFGEGEGHFAPPASVGLEFGEDGISVGDLNGDGRPDLLINDWWNRGWRTALNRGVAARPEIAMTARVDEWVVTLDWTWPAVASGHSYRLYRTRGAGDPAIRLETAPSRPTETGFFHDDSIRQPGQYVYELRQIQAEGFERVVSRLAVDVAPPLGALALRGLWPNPARSNVTLELERGAPGADDLLIFDASGRRVGHLSVTAPGAGRWSETWDLRDDRGQRVPSGLYFLRPANVAGAATRLVVTR